MSRKARVQFEGAIYHVVNRGIDRRELFWDAKDYQVFLGSLEVGVERFHVRLYAYCLMPNHYHLLVETPLGNLDRFMQSVQTRYAGFFNMRHRKSGYVYEGPYRAKLVEGDAYLLKMSRYIHLNAVRTRAMKEKPLGEEVKALRAYRWSSYREYIGKVGHWEWMDYGPVEEHVKEQMGGVRGAYRKYVESGLAEHDEELEELLGGAWVCLGSAEFLKELQERLRRRQGKPAWRSEEGFRAKGRYVPEEEIVPAVCRALNVDAAALTRRRGGAWLRGAVAEMLCRYGGLTQGAAARRLGLTTGASVCIRRKALWERRALDHKLDKTMKRLEQSWQRQLKAP